MLTVFDLQHLMIDKLTPNDYQSTLLYLFGLDPKQLYYVHNGQVKEITNGRESRIVNEILHRPPTV